MTETEDDNDLVKPEAVPCSHDDDKSSEISFGNKSVHSASPAAPDLNENKAPRKRDVKADLKEKHRIQMHHIKS